MIVRVHRYQPRTNKFQIQTFELEEEVGGGKTFFGANFDRRMGNRGAGFVEFRTQRIDWFEVDAIQGAVDIYTSPLDGVGRAPNKKVKGFCAEKGWRGPAREGLAVLLRPHSREGLRSNSGNPLPMSLSRDGGKV